MFIAILCPNGVEQPFKRHQCPFFLPLRRGNRAFGAGPSVPGVGARPSAPPPLDPRLPPDVSKRSVVGFRGKDQQVAVAEYSRLLVLFLVLGQYDAHCAVRTSHEMQVNYVFCNHPKKVITEDLK